MIQARVAGIPCLIQVDRCMVVKGSYSYDAPSDHDYRGYSEIEFTVCDRRGHPAPWLERKMTYDDRSDIETLILESYKDD